MKNKSITQEIRYTAPSSWWEHVPMAHWLVENLQPECVVELGSHYGVSFFAFCEAAELWSKHTYIYAIDTWKGDEHAGYYDNEVFNKVSIHQQTHHAQRSQLIRSTFSEAAEQFSDGSLDLIHIDGLHTYEAVRRDYDEWKVKLKHGGSVIFHDWNVREDDFGVWKLWEEIKEDNTYKCIEVPYGHGLGIATYSEEEPSWHKELISTIPVLRMKGKYLSESQSQVQKQEMLEKLLSTEKKHAINLEAINSNLRNEVNALTDEIKVISAQCKKN